VAGCGADQESVGAAGGRPDAGPVRPPRPFTDGLAAQIAELAIYGIDLRQIGNYIEQVQAVTPKQVEAYARKHLDADGSKAVVVGDTAQFATALRKAHPHAALLESTTLDLDSPSLLAPTTAK